MDTIFSEFINKSFEQHLKLRLCQIALCVVLMAVCFSAFYSCQVDDEDRLEYYSGKMPITGAWRLTEVETNNNGKTVWVDADEYDDLNVWVEFGDDGNYESSEYHGAHYNIKVGEGVPADYYKCCGKFTFRGRTVSACNHDGTCHFTLKIIRIGNDDLEGRMIFNDLSFLSYAIRMERIR